ncbi:hypothetical protein J4228_02245 [Candidatus Woesearchaeota archaeon]|nr:hypothetical protein [Candidatus Woesearchaeota archaeon]
MNFDITKAKVLISLLAGLVLGALVFFTSFQTCLVLVALGSVEGCLPLGIILSIHSFIFVTLFVYVLWSFCQKK